MKHYEVTLTSKGESLVLTTNPENIQSIGGVMVRSEIYHGFPRLELKVSVRFPLTDDAGGNFILEAYEDAGIEAEIICEIKRRNTQTWAFDDFYVGLIDVKPDTFKIDYTERFIECNITDSSKQNKFASRDEINYNVFQNIGSDNVSLPAFNNTYHEINLTPIDIYLGAEFEGFNDTIQYASPVPADGSIILLSAQPFITSAINLNDLDDRLALELNTPVEPIYTNTTGGEIKLYINEIAGTFTTETIITGTFASSIPFFHQYIMYVKDADDNYGEGIVLNNQTNDLLFTDTLPKTINSSGSFDDNWLYVTDSELDPSVVEILFSPQSISPPDAYLTVPIDGTVYFELRLIAFLLTPASWSGISQISMEYTSQITSLKLTELSEGIDETTSKGMFIHEALTKTIQLATGETNPYKVYYSDLTGRTNSEFNNTSVNGDAAYDFVTSGLLVRGANTQLNVSIRKLFQTLDGIYNCMLAYDFENQMFYIKNKSAAYNRNFLFDIGEVKNLVKTPYKKAFFSEIVAGISENAEYEKIQGAKEFNSKTEYTLSTPIKNKLDITIPLRTDSIAIELTRREQVSSNNSKDTRNDDSLFYIKTNGTSPILAGNDIVDGFRGSSAYYNLYFTARNCIIRWSNYIRSGLWKSSNKLIKFVRNRKNIDINYTLENGFTKNESDDILINEMNETLFIPELVTFEKPVTDEELTILYKDPHGVITFSHDGVDYAFFLNKLEAEDYSKLATWEGILVDYDEVATDSAIWEDGNGILFENGNEVIWSN